MEKNNMIQTAVVRFHHAVLAFTLGALCTHIRNFGFTPEALLVASVGAVAAVVNHIILGGYLHGSRRDVANV